MESIAIDRFICIAASIFYRYHFTFSIFNCRLIFCVTFCLVKVGILSLTNDQTAKPTCGVTTLWRFISNVILRFVFCGNGLYQ
ncbi:hypothetical protein L596_016030 [Steinernema carpocapsae]|uniref:Uncharacterized protein n=1 Tax=Steinernema carpocapsae TaxID=34508 RepID=A0A4V6A3A5_STECR|nr:hypothetical protein L596_016030 [Steinernema carpocapsae]